MTALLDFDRLSDRSRKILKGSIEEAMIEEDKLAKAEISDNDFGGQ